MNWAAPCTRNSYRLALQVLVRRVQSLSVAFRLRKMVLKFRKQTVNMLPWKLLKHKAYCSATLLPQTCHWLTTPPQVLDPIFQKAAATLTPVTWCHPTSTDVPLPIRVSQLVMLQVVTNWQDYCLSVKSVGNIWRIITRSITNLGEPVVTTLSTTLWNAYGAENSGSMNFKHDTESVCVRCERSWEWHTAVSHRWASILLRMLIDRSSVFRSSLPIDWSCCTCFLASCLAWPVYCTSDSTSSSTVHYTHLVNWTQYHSCMHELTCSMGPTRIQGAYTYQWAFRGAVYKYVCMYQYNTTWTAARDGTVTRLEGIEHVYATAYMSASRRALQERADI